MAVGRPADLKPRETGHLPPEKLRETLGKIFPDETVDELMDHFSRMRTEEDDYV